jgi:hypothetical protein
VLETNTPIFTCFTALKESLLIALVGDENPGCLLPVLYALYTTNWTEKHVSFARCGRSCAPFRSFMYSYILDRNTEGGYLPSHYPYHPIIHPFLGHVDFPEQYHSIPKNSHIYSLSLSPITPFVVFSLNFSPSVAPSTLPLLCAVGSSAFFPFRFSPARPLPLPSTQCSIALKLTVCTFPPALRRILSRNVTPPSKPFVSC